ncbi:trichohyalin isoform X1 [Drosophila busckii]|uniref:trichohyalin isoform X1 n=1 Tax=Drosophila busckii TaxID=30019 RepID=UPI0014328553|nr:trichohyalin isoform X1 [Drosophila busckii]
MAADELLTGVGELLFSLLIGYLGALEFAFVARQLYHWSCQHPNGSENADAAADAEELPRLRERLQRELDDAAARESAAGNNKVMQDGVIYSNGFRVESPEDKRKALAAELERQRHIEEDTRKALAQAEHKLAEERKQAEQARLAAEQQEAERKLIEAERQREAEQRAKEDAEENVRKLQAAEAKRAAEQREREENEQKLKEAEQQQREFEENARKLREAEEQREREQRELEENEQRIREAELAKEQEQRELEENEQRIREAELATEQAQRERELHEAELERQLLLQVDEDEEQAKRDNELVQRLLAAERERKLSATESELEEEALQLEQARRLAASKDKLEKKQKSIEENARLFMEAEEEMVMLQQRMLQAAQEDEYAGMVPVVEEPCIKKILPPRFEAPDMDDEEPMMVQRVKTQFGQSSNASEEPYASKSKTLMFPSVDDEGSSVEPNSSQQSSFSTQASEERPLILAENERERPEPEGEDNVPEYTEEYLRSLDGIKQRPLVREDGSGRRRAFKKRRSSGSSNSSRESRTSRDEELKMFTSLEEEELRHGDKEDYNPIKYSSEPTLRVKSHHRRHKRSPAKDVKPSGDAGAGLEMLGEEQTNPWGEVMPEHYKDTEFWKREKALSIDEEELERHSAGEEVAKELPKSEPKSSSFEEANEAQNVEAAATLRQQQQHSKEQLEKDSAAQTSSSDIKTNLQTSSTAEEQSRGGSPGMRRSPRIDEMDHYEERWVENEAANSPPPSITIRQPDTAPWRDEYGLVMEGLSDFYDFTASVNPSRSRSNSRNPSPTPKNVANRMDVDLEHTLEIYDDTQQGLLAGELNCETVLQMLTSSMNGHQAELPLQNVADDVKHGSNQVVSMVYETVDESTQTTMSFESAVVTQQARARSQSLPESLSDFNQQQQQAAMELEVNGVDAQLEAALPQPVIEINALADEEMEPAEVLPTREEMRLFVETMRAERNSRSRSRSRSPLPTADNLARSLETRRQKRIRQNDELFEQLQDVKPASSAAPLNVPMISIEAADEPPNVPMISIEVAEEPVKDEMEDTPESMAKLFAELRMNRCRSHSRSRSKSPLPTASNIEQSLQHRREKLIAQNDAFFEQLQRAATPEPELRFEYVEEGAALATGSDRDMRSLSPSRSRSRSRSHSDGDDFELSAAEREEMERLLAQQAKEHKLDLQALRQLRNASEEMELRMATPERLPDYDRTMSELARDLKDEMVISGFKRSTYVGESLELGENYEQLREEAAHFRRSRTPSPDLSVAREKAAAQRELQAAIIDSLVSSSGQEENRLGAKPKTNEYERNFSEQLKDTQRMQQQALESGFKRSTYVGESLDLSIDAELDEARAMSDFQRSRSQSRSPAPAEETKLDAFTASSVNFQNFSRYLNTDFLESERRASDSALIQLEPYAYVDPEEYHHYRRFSLAQEQPVEEYPSDECVYISQIEVHSLTGKRTWIKEDFYTHDLRSFNEEMLSFVEEERKKSAEYLSEGSWAQAVLAAEAEAAEFDATSAIYNFDIVEAQEEFSSNDDNDSEDERQTVVEIDDDEEYEFELDEGISDNNERTQPTDESHHDTSECEEAERNADRYANRDAQDWEEVDNVQDYGEFGLDDGAVGGSDPDSFIEQIYKDAVKNRKQSGILRDYETMIQEQLTTETEEQSDSDKEQNSAESERYALWAKTRELSRSEERNRHREVDLALGLIESERRDTEMRYLSDAHMAARQSARLRTRYGYNPQLQVDVEDDDIEVDLNYKPKREYNWRKNFKLDDDNETPQSEAQLEEQKKLREEYEHEQLVADTLAEESYAERQPEQPRDELDYTEEDLAESMEAYDDRRFSLGGESITLFSRSPVREVLSDVPEEELPLPEQPLAEEKPKKKKSKKKTRKGEAQRDDNDSDNGNAKEEREAEAADPPKRKMRSRRSSKSGLANEETNGNGNALSPRNSIGFETLQDIAEFDAGEATAQKKKLKKRKKLSKESSLTESEQPASVMDAALAAALAEIAPITVSASTNLTPASTQANLLSSISSASLCITPASSFDEPDSAISSSLSNATAVSSVVTPARSVVDTFDILKDANFYPLF